METKERRVVSFTAPYLWAAAAAVAPPMVTGRRVGQGEANAAGDARAGHAAGNGMLEFMHARQAQQAIEGPFVDWKLLAASHKVL